MHSNDDHLQQLELRNITHSVHTSGIREGFYAFSVVCLCSIVFFSVYPATWLPVSLKVLITLVAAVAAAIAFVVWIGGKRRRETLKAAIENREIREAETQRQIDEMRSANSKVPKIQR